MPGKRSEPVRLLETRLRYAGEEADDGPKRNHRLHGTAQTPPMSLGVTQLTSSRPDELSQC